MYIKGKISDLTPIEISEIEDFIKFDIAYPEVFYTFDL